MSKLANVQRLVTNACLVSGKPVVIASQILESMCDSPRPSRSEAFDLFNCVLSGVDAYVLSSETATGTIAFRVIGAYPLESLLWLAKICHEAERSVDFNQLQAFVAKNTGKPIAISESIASSAGTACFFSSLLCEGSVFALHRCMHGSRRHGAIYCQIQANFDDTCRL